MTMIKEIVTDKKFLAQKCEECVGDEYQDIVLEMVETANSIGEECAGLAANQIGYHKRVILLRQGPGYALLAMVNPKVVMTGGGMEAGYERCLSRLGEAPIRKERYKKITIEAQGQRFVFKGKEARVVQHELDHLEGVLI